MSIVETGVMESLPRLGEYLVPHGGPEYLYFGLGLLGFAFIVLRDRGSLRLVVLFLLSIAAALALVLAKALFVDGALPFAKGFNVFRLMQFMPMVLALASGFAYQHVRTWSAQVRQSNVRHFIPTLLVVAWFLVSLEPKAKNLRDWVGQGNFRNNLESPVIEDLAAKVRTEMPPPRVAAHQFYASYLPAYGLEITGGALTLYPRRYREFWELVIAPMRESDPKMHGFLAANKLRLRMTTYRREARVEFARYYDLDLLSLANTRYVLSCDELAHPDLTVVRDSAVNWNELTRGEKIKAMLRGNLEGRDLIKIYENQNALPRVFAPQELRVFETKEELFEEMKRMPAAGFRDTLLALEADVPVVLSGRSSLGIAKANIVRYESDKIVFDVQADGPSIIFVGNSFSPFWRRRSELLESQVFPAYHAFWAVPVRGGESRIFCEYRPPYTIGRILSRF